MTISNQTVLVSYNGNGSTTSFAITQSFKDNSEIDIYLVSSAGVETLKTVSTHYTFVGGNPATSITMVTAPAVGEKLLIKRDTARTQISDYQGNSVFPAESHEAALDKLTQIVQEVSYETTRSVKMPLNETGAVGYVYPSATDRANKYLAFNSLGVPVAQAGTTTPPVNYVNSVKDYGAVGDGVVDDTAAFQDALDDAGFIFVPAGTYKITSTLSLSSNTHLFLDPDAVMDFTSAGLTDNIISCTGTIGSNLTLSANVAAQARLLSLSAATGLSAGDFIKISSDALYDSGNSSAKIGEIQRIQTVSSTTVITEEPLEAAYATADAAKVQELTFKENVIVEGGTWEGLNIAGGADQLGIFFAVVRNCHVKNLLIRDFADNAIRMRDALDCSVTGCTSRSSESLQLDTNETTQQGSGIAIGAASRNVLIFGNRVVDCKYGISVDVSATVPGIPRKITISHNNIHQSSIQTVDTTATFTVDTGTDIVTLSSAMSVTGNMVTVSSTGTLPAPLVANTAYYVGLISGATYYFYTSREDAYADTNRVNFTSTGSGTHTASELDDKAGFGIYVQASSEDIDVLNNTISHMYTDGIYFAGRSGLISGNYIEECAFRGIYHPADTGISNNIRLKIADNTVRKVGTNGIQVDGSSTRSSEVVSIVNNYVSAAYDTGIRVVGNSSSRLANVTVSNNTVRNIDSTRGIRIEECNNVVCSGNVIGDLVSVAIIGLEIDDCRDFVVSSNSLSMPSGTTGVGILIDSNAAGSSQYGVISSNRVYTPLAGGADEGILVDADALNVTLVGNEVSGFSSNIVINTGADVGVIGDPQYQRQAATIASGAITVQSKHVREVYLSSEGGASTDDLDTINGGEIGQLIVVRSNSSSQDITFTDGTGNLTLRLPFTTLTSSDTITILRSTSTWLEVARCSSTNAVSTNFPNKGTETIASGVISLVGITHTLYTIDTESSAATDDLDTITATNIPEGTMIIVKAANATRTVVMKDATGNLRLAGDFSMDHSDDRLMLLYSGTNWIELSRSDNSA